MLCHDLMRFIFDSLNLAAILKLPDNSSENHLSAAGKIDNRLWFSDRFFTQ